MSASTISNIRIQVAHVGISTLLLAGNIGNFFTILILGRTLKHRINSCALYLFCASIANWFVIDTVLSSMLYGIDHIEPIHTSNVLCKLRSYGAHVLFTASRSFMIAAVVDRWALCSPNIKIRSMCRPGKAYRITAFIIIMSSLLSVPLFIFFDNSSGLCGVVPAYNLAYTIYALIVIGILPSLLMILFAFLARYNLMKIRSRVRPAEGTNQDLHIHKRDHALMKMIVGEILVFCLTTWPYSALTMYNFLTLPIKAYKDPLRLAIESLVGYMIQPLLGFTYCSTQFYVYMYFSRKFREDFLNLFRRGTIPRGMTTTTERKIGHT